MSFVAEYAHDLHLANPRTFVRELEPVTITAQFQKLNNIRAVLFDVYGTLINYWKPGLTDREMRPHILLSAFKEVAHRFGMTAFLAEMNPDEAPQKTLNDLYHGLIALNHEKSLKKGIAFPEVKIEEVWALIILMLKRRGYEPAKYYSGTSADFPRCCAYCYNFFSLGCDLYEGVIPALLELKKNNIKLGIVSNAQFYTPIDLTLLFRDKSNGLVEDLNEMFDPDLTFFSYEYGVAKPNRLLFGKLYDALYEYQILPEQTVFAGNDLSMDIEPAQSIGMRSALFTGDKSMLYLHNLEDSVFPDISFSDWKQLPEKLSFFDEKADSCQE